MGLEEVLSFISSPGVLGTWEIFVTTCKWDGVWKRTFLFFLTVRLVFRLDWGRSKSCTSVLWGGTLAPLTHLSCRQRKGKSELCLFLAKPPYFPFVQQLLPLEVFYFQIIHGFPRFTSCLQLTLFLFLGMVVHGVHWRVSLDGFAVPPHLDMISWISFLTSEKKTLIT